MKIIDYIPEGWYALTFFYDYHDREDIDALNKEVERLQSKGEEIILHSIDTRNNQKTVEKGDRRTTKPSVYVEICVKEKLG